MNERLQAIENAMSRRLTSLGCTPQNTDKPLVNALDETEVVCDFLYQGIECDFGIMISKWPGDDQPTMLDEFCLEDFGIAIKSLIDTFFYEQLNWDIASEALLNLHTDGLPVTRFDSVYNNSIVLHSKSERSGLEYELVFGVDKSYAKQRIAERRDGLCRPLVGLAYESGHVSCFIEPESVDIFFPGCDGFFYLMSIKATEVFVRGCEMEDCTFDQPLPCLVRCAQKIIKCFKQIDWSRPAESFCESMSQDFRIRQCSEAKPSIIEATVEFPSLSKLTVDVRLERRGTAILPESKASSSDESTSAYIVEMTKALRREGYEISSEKGTWIRPLEGPEGVEAQIVDLGGNPYRMSLQLANERKRVETIRDGGFVDDLTRCVKATERIHPGDLGTETVHWLHEYEFWVSRVDIGSPSRMGFTMEISSMVTSGKYTLQVTLDSGFYHRSLYCRGDSMSRMLVEHGYDEALLAVSEDGSRAEITARSEDGREYLISLEATWFTKRDHLIPEDDKWDFRHRTGERWSKEAPCPHLIPSIRSVVGSFVEMDWTDPEETFVEGLGGKRLEARFCKMLGPSTFTAGGKCRGYGQDWKDWEYEIQIKLNLRAYTARLEEIEAMEVEEEEAQAATDALLQAKIETSIIDEIDAMDGQSFEVFCARLLERNGYDGVYITKGSGDQGIDVLATKDFVKYGFQCKCYSSDIGNKAVQEAFAGKTYYGCHVAVVLTNRYFTPAAKELAAQTGVVLWDRDKLLSMVE